MVRRQIKFRAIQLHNRQGGRNLPFRCVLADIRNNGDIGTSANSGQGGSFIGSDRTRTVAIDKAETYGRLSC